ncbi:MAG: glycosyltransferase family 2 protein [Gemmobacter sp.]|uniref:glycosyltransferase family 2 protein n=1 Tax=Gemmobacter sp. TaxID=1898957 RepID=UPI0039187CB2
MGQEASVLRRPMQAQLLAEGLAALDAVAEPGDPGRFRVFLASGTDRGLLDPLPGPARAEALELREVGGGILYDARGPRVLALAAGGGAEVAATSHERGLLAGRNVLLGFRIDEPAQTVAEWLTWHVRRHGADGALIVNRAPPETGHAAFAQALSDALGDLPVRVVLVEPDVPLGKPGLGPESHPFLAPDAPGKDRMPVPAPDPWRAPLGEGLVLEALKWRYLAEARAVLLLDPCDILPPRDAGAPSAFDLCRAARQGVVFLVGHRIYPWRVRTGQPARFGDHICRQFDARRGIARWGVAPDKAGLDNTWRGSRVSYAKPDPGVVVPFLRAMAIRVPGRSSAELAPKTSLIEDPALIALAEALDWKPVRAPASAIRAERTIGNRTAIVTTMKNEGPFILEWVAWHRAIGVQDFLVYTNDCTDGTDTFLMLLQDKGIVQHRVNPWQPGGELKPQHAALQAAESEPVIQNADWAICMDVDEFINIKLGDGRLPTLFAAMEAALPGANMISLTWRLFGNSDVDGYEDRFLLDQFVLCAPEVVRKPHQAWGFKTLFRNIELYKKLGVHRPKGLKPDLWDQVKWLNGSGKRMPKEMFRNGWRSTLETYGYDWVQLNHYAVRSAESFLVKRDRGRVNHVDRDQGLHYWFRMNHNVVEDRSIQARIPLLQAEWDRLMADPDIRAAHQRCVAAHKAKIAELQARPEQAAFHAELTGPRMRRLSRLTPHFGSAVFNAGPQVVPDEIALADSVAPGFFFTVQHEGGAAH